MNHEFSVTVRVDVETSTILLAVTGCLTRESHRSLLALILRARNLSPVGQVTVDLTGARHIDVAGLDPLRSAIDRDERDSLASPVLFHVPEPLPACPASGPVASLRTA